MKLSSGSVAVQPVTFKMLPYILALICLALIAPAVAQSNSDKIRNANWYIRPIAEGVVAKSYQFDNLFSTRQSIYFIEADMNVAGTNIRFPYRQNGTRLSVPEFASSVQGAAVAVNGNFYGDSGSVQFLRVNGATVSSSNSGTGGIAVTAEGDPLVIQRPAAGWSSLTEPDVMATITPVMVNGIKYSHPFTSFYTGRHPRTVIGKTTTNTLLMVVIDGRSASAAGMSYNELFETMKALGAHNAINMDGGGSATLWDWDTPGNGVFSIPSDGYPRSVANSVVLVAPPLSTPTPPFDARRAYSGFHASPHRAIRAVVESGESISVSMDFLNRGTETWTASNCMLATTEERNRESAFYVAGQWLNPSTVVSANTSSVAPGAVGRFTFSVKAPVVPHVTQLHESFGLRTANGEFFGPEQNRVYLTVVPPPGPEIVLESRFPGGDVNTHNYFDYFGFADTTSKSFASNPSLYGTGARFSTTIGSSATFTPNIPTAGYYNIYITMGSGGNNNATASYTIDRPGGILTGSVVLVYSDTALVNKWKLLRSNVYMPAGDQSSITFTNTNGNSGTNRLVMDAVRFSRIPDSAVTDWSVY